MRTTSRGSKRLADRVVLVFDGDAAGQTAADRALEFFLGHELDVRVLSLAREPRPLRLPPEGGGRGVSRPGRAGGRPAGLRPRAGRSAVRPRFDRGSAAGGGVGPGHPQPDSRRASGSGLDLKLAKALDTLAHRLGLPVDVLRRRLRELRRTAASRPGRAVRPRPPRSPAGSGRRPRPIRRLPRPSEAAAGLRSGSPTSIRSTANWSRSCSASPARSRTWSPGSPPPRSGTLRCGRSSRPATTSTARGNRPCAEEVMDRLDDPRVRALVAGLLLPIGPGPLARGRASRSLARSPQGRARHARRARAASIGSGTSGGPWTKPMRVTNPDAYRALQLEYLRLMIQRPDTKKDAS